MSRLIVIDDEPNVLYSLRQALSRDGLEVETAQTARQGLGQIRQTTPDAVILDVRLPDMSGLEAFDKIREVDPQLPVIVITAFATTETAIEAMKRGAFEYLLKPVDLRQLRRVVAQALEVSRHRHGQPEADVVEGKPGEIVGQSAAMQEVYKAIGRTAPQDVTVLVVGESGTGKELVARSLHQHSRRASGPFLAINCAAIPEQLLESELFGHEKGAFTGADRLRPGKFEQASGGTLFLDEIGDMSPATQAKVLRLLQEQRFERLGGTTTISSDVRLIAATNQDLDAQVAAGRFRRDLLYRLNGFTIHLPPLRQRLEDIPDLVQHFVSLFNREHGKSIRSIHPEVIARLQRHDWPGNVRELQSAIRFAVVNSVGETLTVEHLPAHLRDAERPPTERANPLDILGMVEDMLARGDSDIYRRVNDLVDRVVIERVLRHVNGNQVHASERLGISRTTLRSRIQMLGIPPVAESSE
ncbi:MAG: sigma-54 dependent transcriptional regulator [Gemmataceae bacterium]|nr:sigma-54 dependent transcriptional regulator [Gemmataceae bacterium]